MSAKSGSMQAIGRAASVLRELGRSPAGLSLAELTDRSGLPRSTTHRVLRALEAEGLVARKPGRSGYVIGAEVAVLVGAVRQRLIDDAAPLLADLADRIDEPVALYTYSSGTVLCIHQTSTAQAFAASGTVGSVLPAHCTAAGKAIASALSPELAAKLLLSRFPHTPATINDLEELQQQLRQCQKTGVAWERDEHIVGVSAVATLVPTASREPLAISVSVPDVRFERHIAAIVPAILDTRDRLVGS